MTEHEPQIPHYTRSKTLHNFTLSKAEIIDLCKIAQAQLDECLKITLDKTKWNELDLNHDQLMIDLHKAFKLQIQINAEDESSISLDDISLFDKPDFPDKIRSVYLSHHHRFSAIFNKILPRNYFEIFLDFSKPSLALDFFNLPSNPTPNESKFQLNGLDESWIDSTFLKFDKFFKDHKNRRAVIHKSGIYDIFLYALFIPFSLFWLIKIENNIANYINDLQSTFLKVFIYGYIILIFGLAGRFSFQYMRWIFPRAEYNSGKVIGSLAHRAFLGSITIIFIVPLLFEAAKFILFP